LESGVSLDFGDQTPPLSLNLNKYYRKHF